MGLAFAGTYSKGLSKSCPAVDPKSRDGWQVARFVGHRRMPMLGRRECLWECELASGMFLFVDQPTSWSDTKKVLAEFKRAWPSGVFYRCSESKFKCVLTPCLTMYITSNIFGDLKNTNMLL
jgi:hypothetical protein